VLWFFGVVGTAVIFALLSLRGERKRAEYVAAAMTALDEPPAGSLPPVTIVVPVTRATPASAETLRLLAAQEYPSFELLIVAPDAESLTPGILPRSVKVVLAGDVGPSSFLRAGGRAARRGSEVFAFAAPSGLVSPRWLRALVAPLDDRRLGATTGFRWYTPDPPAFWPLIRSAWNAVIAGRLGPGANGFAWDGSLAISKSTYFAVRLHEGWSDLAAAVRDARLYIAFAPGAMVAYPGRTTAREFLAQARCEMSHARRHYGRLWWSMLVSHIFYCGAMVAAAVAIARGNRGAEWAIVVLFGLWMLKGANRATLAKAQLLDWKTWFDRYSWTTTFWVPLVMWVWLYVLVSSLFDSNRDSTGR
jgi:hypothetical protein